MRITCRVTQRDIEQGIPQNGYYCPIARAVERALDKRKPKGRQVIVGTHDVSVDGCWIRLPLRALKGRYDFDHGHHVSPFTFSIEVPDGY